MSLLCPSLQFKGELCNEDYFKYRMEKFLATIFCLDGIIRIGKCRYLCWTITIYIPSIMILVFLLVSINIKVSCPRVPASVWCSPGLISLIMTLLSSSPDPPHPHSIRRHLIMARPWLMKPTSPVAAIREREIAKDGNVKDFCRVSVNICIIQSETM